MKLVVTVVQVETIFPTEVRTICTHEHADISFYLHNEVNVSHKHLLLILQKALVLIFPHTSVPLAAVVLPQVVHTTGHPPPGDNTVSQPIDSSVDCYQYFVYAIISICLCVL